MQCLSRATFSSLKARPAKWDRSLSLSVELGKAFRQEKTRYECKHKDFYKGRVGPPRRTGEKEKAALGTGDINGWSITWDKTKEEGALLLVTVSQAATT